MKMEKGMLAATLAIFIAIVGSVLLLALYPSSAAGENCKSPQIKGNISSKEVKIYHLPTDSFYNRTVIDTSKGEKMFCTEADAMKAGFRKSM